ncbi:chromosome condensation complex Condensin, subunit G [Malassezia sp. CBS 17886]|nr:chromosome condensation complex Condensin, subunit G [Malassezia sp. CBS 17886]
MLPPVDAARAGEFVRAHVPPHFQDAQHSLASHRKNVVSLFRVHAQCAQLTEATERGTRLVGEKLFNEAVFRSLNRVLSLKKGVASADRICKFVVAYAAYAQEQFHAAAQRASGARAPADEDTPATRFVAILFKHLLRGFRAKDKNVRIRCCSCVALLINVVECMECVRGACILTRSDDLFETLSALLVERVADREASVRVQAVVALARLQAGDGDEGAARGAGGEDAGATRLLLHVLRHDASAEVRRAALFNITPTAATLPYVLERLQDVDATNRRCVYLGSLAMLLDAQPTVEHEGAAVRESLGLGESSIKEVVRVGLHEREPTVQKAARKLAARWLTAMGGDMVEMLAHLHITRSGSGEAVVLALLEDAAAVRAEVARRLADQTAYWAAVTPEKALLARCFVAYATHHGLDAELDVCVPPVTALVYRIQAEYTQLSAALEQQACEELDEDMPAVQDEGSLARVFVVNEMLALAMHCDYGDELGRRKMFTLVRNMLSNAWLPEALIARGLDVLLRLSSGQRDFMQMVVELVQELDAEPADAALDDADGDESVAHALSWHARVVDAAASAPELAAHHAALDARRLLMVRAMLERVACALQENTAFHGLIPQLIVPAVKSKDAVVREQGLVCLGLCSLLDAKMALDTFPLLLDQIQRAGGTIRVRCVECLFDLIVVHGVGALCSRSAAVAAASEFDGDMERGRHFAAQQMVGFLLSLLEHDDADVQASAAEGNAKLLLTGTLADDDVLKSLVLVYMSPDSWDNQPLRQCLSYFLPLFCSAHARHQRMLQRVFVDTFDLLAHVYADADAAAHMVSPAHTALQLADWCNPERLLMSRADECVHVDVAISVFRHLFSAAGREQRRALTQLLAKLYLPDALDFARICTVRLLVHELLLRATGDEAPLRNAIVKFRAAFEKQYAGVCGDWTPEAAVVDGALVAPELRDLVAFLRALPPHGGGARSGVEKDGVGEGRGVDDGAGDIDTAEDDTEKGGTGEEDTEEKDTGDAPGCDKVSPARAPPSPIGRQETTDSDDELAAW